MASTRLEGIGLGPLRPRGEALAAYLRAVRWRPGASYAYLGLARAYWQLGERRGAEIALSWASRLDPGNPAALAVRREMGTIP